jgi:hypothetical protein
MDFKEMNVFQKVVYGFLVLLFIFSIFSIGAFYGRYSVVSDAIKIVSAIPQDVIGSVNININETALGNEMEKAINNSILKGNPPMRLVEMR